MKESIYNPQLTQLASVEELTGLETLFTVKSPDGTLGHKPGQFVMVSALGIGEAPISISSSPSRSNGEFELCVRKVGNVTNALHNMKPGDTIGIRGPFGASFPIEKFRGKDVLFAPGGLGLAPLRSLINEVLDERDAYERVIILYGAKQRSELLFCDEVAEWLERDDVECFLTVDCEDTTDAWHAGKEFDCNIGVITTLFPDIDIDPENTVAATCGPPIMYRFVLQEMLKKGIPEDQIYLSLERRMKCGVGKCGHCQIESLYCCQDGPVFNYAEIKGFEEAL
ncbi:MAG: FAD/NAD(P)-binding protein [Chloroflexota bacterium]|nr:FAD/NAD(P)-binding protein [Chloroflexota bacterium]